MLDTHIRHGYLDDVKSLSDSRYPLVASNRREPLGYFIQRGRCDFNRVRYTVHDLDRDAA